VNHGTLRLVDSVILNADPGIAEGGILNLGTLAVIRSSFEANQQRSASDGGGAILNRGSLGVSCSRFLDNQASQGGAIYNALGGIAQVDHSHFRGNRANGGGGVFNADGITLEAGENFWGEGNDPVVDDLLMGTDTVSSKVQFAPALPTDPTQEAACQPPPPSSPPALPFARYTAHLHACRRHIHPDPDPLLVHDCTLERLTGTPRLPYGAWSSTRLPL